jgi:Ser/Thr protein kinase RdoA (MazF antagonist)
MLEGGPRSPQRIPTDAAESDTPISITEKKLTSEPSDLLTGAVDAMLRSYRRVLTTPTCQPVERPGFSGALVLRVETPIGSFCLRGWPSTAEGSERILALHELLRYVHSRGINYVAVPVTSDEGTTLASVAGRFWQLEPWLPGQADFWSRPSEARLAAAFAALGRFHQAARGFKPAGTEASHLGPAAPAAAPTVLDRIARMDRWTPDRVSQLREGLRGIAGDAQRLGGGEDSDRAAMAAIASRICLAFERCAPWIAQELRLAARVPVPLQPCLRDVWHDHVLFQDDVVTGLIDPTAARTDTVAADISRLAGSLIADDRRAWQTAVNAYQAVRPLSAAESTLVGVLDRSGVLLSGMTWLERPDFWRPQPSVARRLIERLERIAARAETLARSFQ